MKTNHSFYSKLALYLAEKNLGKTSNNPSVGCVIVKNDSVISSGVTSVGGRPHAEVNALNKDINFTDSDMYVTLEPCTHYGITPPCTNIIKRKRINKVYYLFNDPDKRTHHKNNKFKNFYKSYLLNKNNKFPLIDAKLAISKDFFTINKKSKWITNSRSRKVAHLIRSNYDCIVSTSESVNKDNSLLNCRIDGLNNLKPDLVIIDRSLKIRENLKLFDLSGKRKITIITAINNKKKISSLKKKRIKIIIIKKLVSKKDFNFLFQKIFKLNNGRILVETGLVFLKQLFDFNLINNLHLFKSNVLLKNNGYNKCSIDFIKKLKFNNKVNVNLNNNKLFKIRIK